jgi:hypothetical protein
VRAGLSHETVPLPHEVNALLAEGKIDPADYDAYVEGVVNAALATATPAARAGPTPDAPGDRCTDEAAALPVV